MKQKNDSLKTSGNLKEQLFFFLFALLSLTVSGQTTILNWNASGVSGFGPSPWTPATINPNITSSGLIRGNSLGISGSAAAGCWGGQGTGWNSGSGTINDNSSFHFTIVASEGYKISLNQISTRTRRSGTGPTGYNLYYSVNGSAFMQAGTTQATSVTTGTVGTPGSIDLSGIAALQNVPVGQVIKFRITPQGTTGNYYLTGDANALVVTGNVELDGTPDPMVNAITLGMSSIMVDVVSAEDNSIMVAYNTEDTFGIPDGTYNAEDVITGGGTVVYLGSSSDFTHESLDCGTTYYYKAWAYNAFLEYSSGVTASATTQSDVSAPAAEAQSFCGEAIIANLTASGSDLKWYASDDSTIPLTDATVLQAGIYYVSQTINNCESERTAVEVTINELPGAPLAEAQAFCTEAMVADLTAGGTELKWYAAIDATEELTDTTPLQTAIYYVSQTANGCESERTAVEVTITETEAPVTEVQTFCGEATVADLIVTVEEGALVNWYDSFEGGTPLDSETALSTGIYYVTQVVNGCESPFLGVIVLVNEIPDAPLAEAQVFCGDTQVSDLTYTASSEAVIKWYISADTTEALAVSTALQTGTYYVSQTINDCESPRAEVVVTVNEIPSLPVVESQDFCGAATVADLQVISAGMQWYATADAAESLASETALQTGIYYVSQVINGCESTKTGVFVTVNQIPDAPLTQAQSFCVETTATVADLVAQGSGLQWYVAVDAAEALAGDTVLQTGNYYVSQTINDCESPRTEVPVTINMIPPAPIAQDQAFCGTTTIAYLSVTVVNEASVTWYESEEATEALPGFTFIYDGMTYYVSQTLNGCESPRTAVTVTINPIPLSPSASEQQYVCEGSTVAELIAEGENLLWYFEETEGEPLAEDQILVSGTYYVSQTVNGCESSGTIVIVTTGETTEAPLAETEQEYQAGATLNDLTVEGENLSWYDAEGNQLDTDTFLTDNTTYYVSQTVNGCEGETIAITVNETLRTNSFEDIAFSYYPNPVTDLLYISYSENITSVAIFNLLGQQLKIVNRQSPEITLDLSDFPEATYVVKIIAGDKEKIIKVIKR